MLSLKCPLSWDQWLATQCYSQCHLRIWRAQIRLYLASSLVCKAQISSRSASFGCRTSWLTHPVSQEFSRCVLLWLSLFIGNSDTYSTNSCLLDALENQKLCRTCSAEGRRFWNVLILIVLILNTRNNADHSIHRSALYRLPWWALAY